MAFRNRRSNETKRPGYVKAWRQKNKDKCAAYTKKWNTANTAQRRAIEKSWRKRNPEKVAAMNSKGGKKWAANNRGRRNFSVRARVAANGQRTPPWADMEAIAAVYVRCAEITKATGMPHEVDHIFPLQGETCSGLHIASNLQILPRSANRSKGNKLCVA